MKTYDDMTPDEQIAFREGALLSAVKDAWYLLANVESYVSSNTQTTEQVYQSAKDRLKRVMDWHESTKR